MSWRSPPHAAEVAHRTGLRLSPHYAAPKLARMLEMLPDGVRRAESGGLVAGTLDAFLVRRLTGLDATEPGHAGRTLLYNLEAGDWDARLCDLFGIPGAALPELLPSAGEWAEFEGVPLVAVAGDQQAALLGHGGWERGVTAVHLGTGAFVPASTGRKVRRHPGLLSAVIAELSGTRRFQLEGTVNSAGRAADWACRVTGRRLEEWTERPLEPERLPLVLPAFAGVGAPWWRPEADPMIEGLDLAASGVELVGGVLAGVAMRVVDCLEAQREAGVDGGILRMSGRLTRLKGFVDLIAEAGRVPVEVAEEEETGLTGMARLAAAVIAEDEAPLTGPPPVRRRREPAWDVGRVKSVRDRWRQFVRRALGD